MYFQFVSAFFMLIGSVYLLGIKPKFEIEKVITKIQGRMRNGFPLVGVPPLVPYTLKSRNNSLKLSFIEFNSSLHNLLLDGLDKFKINHVEFNLMEKSMNFSLKFNELDLNGKYAGQGRMFNRFPIRGNGTFDFTAYDLSVDCRTQLFTNKLFVEITDFDADFHMGKLRSNITGLLGDRFIGRSINRIVNRLAELTVPRIFNFNQGLINLAITSSILPIINRILSSFSIFKRDTKENPIVTSGEEETIFLIDSVDGNQQNEIIPTPLPTISSGTSARTSTTGVYVPNQEDDEDNDDNSEDSEESEESNDVEESDEDGGFLDDLFGKANLTIPANEVPKISQITDNALIEKSK